MYSKNEVGVTIATIKLHILGTKLLMGNYLKRVKNTSTNNLVTLTTPLEQFNALYMPFRHSKL